MNKANAVIKLGAKKHDLLHKDMLERNIGRHWGQAGLEHRQLQPFEEAVKHHIEAV
jgi:hypothetical protein